MDIKTYNQIMVQAIKNREEHPSLRIGQAFFNILSDVNPEYANTIRGTSKDMFQDVHEWQIYKRLFLTS